MDKFLKIFDIIFLAIFMLLALMFVVCMLSFPDIYRYVDKIYVWGTYLFIGLAFGIRAFIKTRSFSVFRKLKYPPRYSCLSAAALFISGGIGNLTGSPILCWSLIILTFVFLFLARKKGEFKRK